MTLSSSQHRPPMRLRPPHEAASSPSPRACAFSVELAALLRFFSSSACCRGTPIVAPVGGSISCNSYEHARLLSQRRQQPQARPLLQPCFAQHVADVLKRSSFLQFSLTETLQSVNCLKLLCFCSVFQHRRWSLSGASRFSISRLAQQCVGRLNSSTANSASTACPSNLFTCLSCLLAS
jgi:hypothetical protein